MFLPTFTRDRHQPSSGEIDPSAASNEIAVTPLLREVKSGRAKFGQLYCAWGCFHVFGLCS
ncbi:hypothetical protein IVB40_27255 [Bradyrhizobium sp. 40]|jgi:hypothetical protein|uniref:hypothetical protein n=1 Tax=unclassified Bradyrhizobium TaxID=2631580 RepID=UPI0018CC78BA|nr:MULTISPECIES: hypothetical protein [unclassified Bradyrhizobium]MCK1405867.1 hypothetical protein [Bradyrhizobium sp. 76]UPJ40962.1 hypothetical protein IVB40_27255 [Bradyrhizobium sp. 40]